VLAKVDLKRKQTILANLQADPANAEHVPDAQRYAAEAQNLVWKLSSRTDARFNEVTDAVAQLTT